MPSLPTRLLLLGIDRSTSFLLPLNQHLGGQNTQSTSLAAPMGKQRPKEDVICLDNAETLPTNSFPCCLPRQSQTPTLDDSVLISFTFKHESLFCGVLGDLSVLPDTLCPLGTTTVRMAGQAASRTGLSCLRGFKADVFWLTVENEVRLHFPTDLLAVCAPRQPPDQNPGKGLQSQTPQRCTQI